MFKPKKILVPTDFSDYSDRALQKALDIAKAEGSEVLLLHIIHEDFQVCVVDYCFTVEEIEAIKGRMFEAANENMKKQLEKFPISKEVKASTEVRNGVPYHEILKFQEENGVDLIIIASHGRSGIARYLMGSVATKVVDGAKCEVLVLK
jgi:universal stress protein A